MRRANILKKHFYYYHYCFCNYCYSIIVIAFATDKNDEISKIFWSRAKKVFKSGTSVSISQRRSGRYLLYGRIETYKSHESVYNSFLDAQIKGTGYFFKYVSVILKRNYTNHQRLKSTGSTMSVRPDIDNLAQQHPQNLFTF